MPDGGGDGYCGDVGPCGGRLTRYEPTDGVTGGVTGGWFVFG